MLDHRNWAAAVEGDKYRNGVGVGMEPNITMGSARREVCSDYCVCSKLELGTWVERLSEMCIEIEQSQTAAHLFIVDGKKYEYDDVETLEADASELSAHQFVAHNDDDKTEFIVDGKKYEYGDVETLRGR